MSHRYFYEAPARFELDGFVEPTDRPMIRIVAPPNARSSHALAAAIATSLGSDREVITRTNGESALLATAAAWAITTAVGDVFIAAAEDLTRQAILDSIDFAGQIGAHLHLVFSHGQVATHSATLREIAFGHRPFTDLPATLRSPDPAPPAPENVAPADSPLSNINLPEDHWTSFRAAYHSALPQAQVAAADAIYLDAYATCRASDAATPDEITALAGSLWDTHGLGENERLITVRALQAAMFRNGLLVRVNLHHFTRYTQQHHVNPLTADHYLELRGFLKPWRPAATVLHAHHITSEASVALRALDVTEDGTIPTLNLRPIRQAGDLLAAQRWHQLITEDADPLLFGSTSINKLRAGIRAVTRDLNLPLPVYWRSQKEDKGRGNIGIRVEGIA